MIGKGFFRAGFTGWFRGRIEQPVIGKPGKFTLGIRTAGAGLGFTTASIGLSMTSASMGLGHSTAVMSLGTARATMKLGME